MTDLPEGLSFETSKHATAMFFGKSLDLLSKGSAKYIDDQGTLTLFCYRGLCLGVTNQHVVGEYAGPSKDKLFHIALRRHQPIPGRLLFKSTQGNPDFPFDIAVFLLDRTTIVAGGKSPIDLSESFEPLEEGDQALAVGFPGRERYIENEFRMAHPIYHVIATCVCASDRKIVLYEKLCPPSDRTVRFGGMSGGPIFRLRSPYHYSFSGILFEGRGFDDNRNGARGDEIWVYGFPLGPAQLEHAFNIFRPNLQL